MKKLLCAVVALVAVVSCKEAVIERDIDLTQPTRYEYARIGESRVALLKISFPVTTAAKPPRVEGAYLSSPMVPASFDLYFRISNQNDATGAVTVEMRTDSPSAVTETAQGFIFGNGNNFTIFANIISLNEVKRNVAYLLAGNITENGIENFHFMTEVIAKDYDPGNKFPPEEDLRVFIDGNGLAEKTDWKW